MKKMENNINFVVKKEAVTAKKQQKDLSFLLCELIHAV